MIKTVICYHVKEPMILNEGTQWERSYYDFLSYYTYKTLEEGKIEAEKLNKTKPAMLWNGKKIDWDEIDYFFATEQEEMCD